MPARVAFRQILRNRPAFAVYEQQAMAVLVDLHVIACTDPGAVLGLFGRVRIETAWAERPPKQIEVSSQALYHCISDCGIRMGGGSNFPGVDSDEFFNPLDAIRCGHVGVCPLSHKLDDPERG